MLSVTKLFTMPWRSYSPRAYIDTLFPFAYVPVSLFAASFSLYWTVAVFIIMGILLFCMRRNCLQAQPRFFIMWLISSIIWLLIIFNAFVISLLEILPEENLLLIILSGCSLICLYSAKIKAHVAIFPNKSPCGADIEAIKEDDIETLIPHGETNGQLTFCYLCQANVPSRDRHCVWLDCCIGTNNHRIFLLGNILGMSALFYGSNLTLTTVCHPFILYKSVLLPDDCSDVYYENNIAICFVCGIYSLIIGCVQFCFLFKRFVRMIRGMTVNRWGYHSSFTWKKWFCTNI